MRTARRETSRWHISPTYGLIGLLAAVVTLAPMRHDAGQGRSWSVVTISAPGWVPRRSDEKQVPGVRRHDI